MFLPRGSHQGSRRRCPGYAPGPVPAVRAQPGLGVGHLLHRRIRGDSPLGIGSLQWIIACDYREHYFTLHEDSPETHGALLRIALFVFITNNTDCKSGHVLRGYD